MRRRWGARMPAKRRGCALRERRRRTWPATEGWALRQAQGERRWGLDGEIGRRSTRAQVFPAQDSFAAIVGPPSGRGGRLPAGRLRMTQVGLAACRPYVLALRGRRCYNSGALPATYVAFDLETTGLDPQSDAIIEIGAVKFTREGVLARFDTLVNPHRPIPERVQQLTGIRHEDVRRAPPPAVVAGGMER